MRDGKLEGILPSHEKQFEGFCRLVWKTITPKWGNRRAEAPPWSEMINLAIYDEMKWKRSYLSRYITSTRHTEFATKKCTLLKHFQGTICAKMRMCGVSCCAKWKSGNAVVRGLEPWSKVVKRDLTSPLPIGDESISGMEALIASRIQGVMQWKIVTILAVS